MMSFKLDGFVLPAAADESDRKLLSDVNSFGWHIVAIAEDEVGPSFAFTVGLFARTCKPEILLMGVPPDAATRVLNSIGEYLMSGGDLEPDKLYSGFVDRCDVIFRTVAKVYYRDYLGYASWFYGVKKHDFPVMQCIWPDLNGVFPDSPEFTERFRKFQLDLSK